MKKLAAIGLVALLAGCPTNVDVETSMGGGGSGGMLACDDPQTWPPTANPKTPASDKEYWDARCKEWGDVAEALTEDCAPGGEVWDVEVLCDDFTWGYYCEDVGGQLWEMDLKENPEALCTLRFYYAI